MSTEIPIVPSILVNDEAAARLVLELRMGFNVRLLVSPGRAPFKRNSVSGSYVAEDRFNPVPERT